MKANTIYEAVRPLYIFLKIAPTIPYRYNKTLKCYENSKTWLLIVVVFISAYTISFLAASTESTIDFTDNAISNLGGWFQLYSGVFLITVAVLMNCLKRNKLVKVYKKIEAIDKTFQRIGVQVQYKKLQIFCIIGIFLSFLELLLTFPTDLVFFIKGESILYMLTTYSAIAICGFLKVHYVFFLYVLQQRYASINNNLSRKPFLNDLIVVFDELSKISAWIDSIFGPQLIVTFANAFSIITTQCYLIYDNIDDYLYVGNEKMVVNVHFAVQWGSLQVMEVFFMVFFSNYVVREVRTGVRYEQFGIFISFQVRQTPGLVHGLFSSLDEGEDAVGLRLRLFSSNLLHRKIEFTACGMFTIDNASVQTVSNDLGDVKLLLPPCQSLPRTINPF